MKIGVITVIDNWGNYGSVLQALGLKQELERQGHRVYFVKPPFRNGEFARTIRSLWKTFCITDDFLAHRFGNAFLDLLKWVKHSTINTAELLYHRLRYSKWFNRISINEIKKMDCIIYGSDTIWDTSNSAFDSPFFWGKYVDEQGIPKIAYAACAGDSNTNDIKFKNWSSLYLKSFRAIMVRDSNTKSSIIDNYDKEISEVCDPALFLDDRSIITKKSVDSKYILIYSFDLDMIEIEYIKRFAQDRNLKVVCAMGLRKYPFADYNVDCGFEGFSSMVKGADYMYTSTFHGCLFSIIHEKKCIYRIHNKKCDELVNQYGLGSRKFNEAMTYDEFASEMEKAMDDSIGFKRRNSVLKSQNLLANAISLVS